MSIGKFPTNRFHFGRFRTVAACRVWGGVFVPVMQHRFGCAPRRARLEREEKLADVVLGAGAGPCDPRSSNVPR